MANHGLTIVAGVALAALQDLVALVDRLAIELRFGGPSAGEIAEAVPFAGRQIPGRGLRAFDRERLRAVPLRIVACGEGSRARDRRGSAA